MSRTNLSLKEEMKRVWQTKWHRIKPRHFEGIGPVSTTPTCEGWSGGQFFNAIIDEVKLYDRALTADEVQAKFNGS